MTLRIITWNINSVRLRLPLLRALVEEANPDVVCLQEIKVEDAHFPYDAIRELGFPHVAVHGLKGYHGVATLSKKPFVHSERVALMPNDNGRHISVRFDSGLELHNFYVPAGGDIPNREENPYYGYKLDYIEAMHAWFAKHRRASDALILVGDLNVAPLPHDVWSHKALLDVVSHTPAEVERLTALYESLNWQDAARHFTPADQKLYSWWSYRNRDWKTSNKGRRLDHVWLTKPLVPHLAATNTLNHFRDAEKPSDHVPIVVDFSRL
jgi:exodeoxyribonuclease III